MDFYHIMGIPDQDAASLWNPLLYSQFYSNEVLIQSCKIWIKWQYGMNVN